MDVYNPAPFFDTNFFIWFGIGFLLAFIFSKIFGNKDKKGSGILSLILITFFLGIIGSFDDKKSE